MSVAVPSLDAIAADPTRLAALPFHVLVDLRRQIRHLDTHLDAVITRQMYERRTSVTDDRPLATGCATPPADEYLSIRDLAHRLPYDEQTIRNLMTRGVFRRDVHYVKPQGKGRPVFKWSAVRKWVEGTS